MSELPRRRPKTLSAETMWEIHSQVAAGEIGQADRSRIGARNSKRRNRSARSWMTRSLTVRPMARVCSLWQAPDDRVHRWRARRRDTAPLVDRAPAVGPGTNHNPHIEATA